MYTCFTPDLHLIYTGRGWCDGEHLPYEALIYYLLPFSRRVHKTSMFNIYTCFTPDLHLLYTARADQAGGESWQRLATFEARGVDLVGLTIP